MKNVTIYTTTYCPYCKRAKALFDSINVAYTEVNVEEDQALREEMANKYNWQTVPMITIGEEFIGGFDDLQKLHGEGKLMEKLTA